ncbi:MAG: thioredoxin family protein [Verrucomicrobia bacterium]|nr:MAG: thioredoxin family protein [Verrucomicrobiota bacterium]
MKSLLITTLVSAAALAISHAAEIGKAASAFTLKNVKGESVSLADFKGKVVVLEWMNYDCPFVKKQYSSGNMPKLQKQYAEKGVVWLTINSSAEGKQGYYAAEAMAARSKEEGNAATHVLLDADGKVGKLYSAQVTPHMFIICSAGNLQYDGAIDSINSTDAADVAKADALFAKALDAVLAGSEVKDAKNKPYGCSVKYKE